MAAVAAVRLLSARSTWRSLIHPCGYDHVYVTVDHVEISSNGSNWTTIPVSSSVPRPIDLLNLTNGTLLTLGEAPLPAGTYQQVRLVLKTNGSSAPWGNSLVLTGSTNQIPLTTPSSQQSGYKILGPITVQARSLADLVLDFNACNSIVVSGASGQYLLKPIVTAVAQVVSGSISGTTTAGAQVYAEQQSSTGPVIVAGTVADASGNFTLLPIQQSSTGGTVDVVIVPPVGLSKATNIVQNVPVTAGGITSLGAITQNTTAENSASGTVSVSGTPGAANLVIDQTVTSSVARTYQIASTVTTNGTYSYPLPGAGPWLVIYSSTLPLAFAQDTATADAGIYSIFATDAAGAVLSLPVNMRASSAPNINFAF